MFRLIKSKVKDIAFQRLIYFFETKKVSLTLQDVGICTLLCHKDVNLFIYNLQSFFYQLQKNLPIYIVDDGTLTVNDIKKIKTYFSVIIETSESSNRKIAKNFKKYKNLLRFRFDENVWNLKKKFDIFFLHPFNKCIYLDADILWHTSPREIINWLEAGKNTLYYSAHFPYPPNFFGNSEAMYQYTCRLLLNDNFSCPIDPSFNSGLLCIPHKQFINIQKLDEVIKYFYLYNFAYTPVAEETSLYLAGNYTHMKRLPILKYNNAWTYEQYHTAFSKETVSMHYSGNTKNILFKRDAIYLAIKNNFFRGTVQTLL